MHIDRDIVLLILSVCPVSLLCPNKWTYHQTFWRSGRGIIL